MNFNPTYYTHLDKFEFSFLTKNPTTIYTSLFRLEYTTNKDYYFNYKVYYNTHLIGTFNIQNRLNLEYSYFRFENYVLYSTDFQNIITELIYTYELKNIKVKKMEIAIDTKQPLSLRFVKKYNNDKLTMKKGYKYYYFGDAENRKKYGITDAVKYETIYIKSKCDATKAKQRNRYMRIENKTNEIKHSEKDYILKYLNVKGLDINKDIYRLELLLTSENTLKNRKTNQTTLIDFTRLTDANYLTAIFNYYSIFNHSQIINTYSDIPLFTPTYGNYTPILKGKRNKEIENINNELTLNYITANIQKINDINALNELKNEITTTINNLNNCNSLNINHLNDLFD